MAYFPHISPPKPCTHLPFFPYYYMSHPPHYSGFLSLKQYLVLNADHDVYHIAISSSTMSLHSLSPKYSSQHSILQHPQPMFLPQGKRPCFTTTWNKQNYSSVFQSSHIWKANGKTKDLSLNGSRHFLSSICSYLIHDSNVHLLWLFAYIWNLPPFQWIYYIPICRDFILHFVHVTLTHAQFSQHLLPGQFPY